MAPHLLALWIVLGMPIIDLVVTRRLRRRCDWKQRIRYYAGTLVTLWVCAGIAALYLGWSMVLSAGTAVADARASLGSTLATTLVGAIGVAVVALTFQPLIKGLRNRKVFASYRRITRDSAFGFLFPTSESELRWFGALSVTAGVCEEILFRSFLIVYFRSDPVHLGLFSAFLVATIAFGLNHGYQGLGGVIRTTVIGAIFGLIFLSSGSLVLVMAIHAVIDLQVVLMLRPSIREGA